jgi:hypothetical protein
VTYCIWTNWLKQNGVTHAEVPHHQANSQIPKEASINWHDKGVAFALIFTRKTTLK